MAHVFRILIALAILGVAGHGALGPIDVAGVWEGTASLPWRWGMDMNGGVQLVYRLQKSRLREALSPEQLDARLERSRKRLRERIVAFHTEETKVALLGGERILVEVPGIRDIQRVKKEIGRPQYLTIRGVLEESERVEPGEGWWVLPPQMGGGSVRLGPAKIRGEHIQFDQFEGIEPLGQGRFGFSLPLSDDGQEMSAALTTEFEDRQICILLDDVPRSILWVQEGGIRTPQITTGSVADARQLKKLLESGPLPLPFELDQQRAVSPVLAAMRESSLRAITAGVLILVAFFGLNYLHRPYYLLVAGAAVLLEVLLFVWIANLGWVRISLPQLAGLALLVGMSVDAFILVFEHMERAIAEGAEVEDALDVARRAFQTELGVIFWASCTTVATLSGLFFVEGVLGEYFILLALGVCISFSAALYLRLLMGIGPLARLGQRFSREKPFAPWLLALRRLDLVDYSPMMQTAYKVAVPLALGVVLVASFTGLINMGIDFSGGAQVSIETEQPVDPGAVRELADEAWGVRCEIQQAEGDGLLTIRVPRITEDLAAQGERGEGRRPDAPEAQLLRAMKEELNVEATLVGVDLLGSSAALENVLSSLKNAAWGLAILFVLCAILYISLTVPLWIVIALAVDMILVLGVIVATGMPVDYPLIAAFLTFAGYSINDSIVVCHEIRSMGKPHMPEAMKRNDPKLEGLIQDAVRAGIKPLSSRVVLTSVTTMLTMVPLLLSDGVLRTFGLVFVFGTAAGTLSSVFIVGIRARDVVLGDTQLMD